MTAGRLIFMLGGSDGEQFLTGERTAQGDHRSIVASMVSRRAEGVLAE